MKKTVSFDLWNTLIFSNPEYKKQQISFLSKFTNLDKNEIEFRLKLIKFDLDSIHEKFGIQTPIVNTYEHLVSVLEISGILPHKIQIEFDKLFLQYLPTLALNAEYILSDLKLTNYNLAIVSNTVFISGETLRLALQKLNVLQFFSFTYFSDEHKYCKPHINVFNTLHLHCGSLTRNIIHIGDNMKTDIEPALNYGLKTILINSDLSLLTSDIVKQFNKQHEINLLNKQIF